MRLRYTCHTTSTTRALAQCILIPLHTQLNKDGMFFYFGMVLVMVNSCYSDLTGIDPLPLLRNWWAKVDIN